MGKRTFIAACTVGGALAVVLFGFVVLGPSQKPFASEAFGNLYEGQARAWLHGRWDMSTRTLLFERFRVGGKFYMYFGPWPAVLRLPIVAFTSSLDGRLARVSMLLAFAVLLGFSGRILWQARTVTGGASRPQSWRSFVATAGFVFVAGCGSSALFLGSRAWVYHEAVLWGLAWAVAAFSCIIAFLMYGRAASLGWASIAATLAFLSRPSLGSGPVVALGLIFSVALCQHLADRWHTRRSSPTRLTWLSRASGFRRVASSWHGLLTSLAAVMLPVLAYAYGNYAKFGSLARLPYDAQDLQLSRPERQAALAATGDSLFGIRYVPTNLLAYLRPDGIGFRTQFPWVTFARSARIIGNVTFDSMEVTSSVTVTSIALFVLTAFGVFAAVRATRSADDDADASASLSYDQEPLTAAVFRIPLISALFGTAGTFVIADLYERYKGDFVPVLVIGGALGLMWLSTFTVSAPRLRGVAAALLVALAFWSVWVTMGLSLIYQREYSGFQNSSPRARFLGFQLDVNDALGISLPTARRGNVLPVIPPREGVLEEALRTTVPHGSLFVLKECEGLFESTGRSWVPLEGKFPGQARWLVTFARQPPGVRTPLWSAGTKPDDIIWVRWIDHHRVRLEHGNREQGGAPLAVSDAFRVQPGREYRLDVRHDPVTGTLDIGPEGSILPVPETPVFIVMQPARGGPPSGVAQLGFQPDTTLGRKHFAGTIREVSVTPQCDRLTS